MTSALGMRLDERARNAPLISYAQHGEDKTLWRALSTVDHGYYVDVGAESPDVGTVTRAFYERGWCGLNIEPVPSWFEQLKAARPRDRNLNVACGTTQWLGLYEVMGTGLSTVNKDYAERHQRALGYNSRLIEVPCVRLDSLLDGRTIHFLKIDVEGAERDVLLSIDLHTFRPWIILVEATEPNTQVPSHQQWEDLLLTRGYRYSCFDGLNRYYVCEEKFDELHSKLSAGGNCEWP